MSVVDEDGRLARYAELVRACPHNLLSRRGLAELETRHVPESLAFADRLPGRVDLLDVGPGAGLPGMVIAIRRPDITVTMIEATRKKAVFLRETAAALGVEVEVRHGRVEELGAGGPLAGRFDIASARAVAPLERLIGWVLPVLRDDGELWAIKGERWRAELDEAASTIARLGAEVRATPHEQVGDSSTSPDPAVVIIGRARTRAADRGDT